MQEKKKRLIILEYLKYKMHEYSISKLYDRFSFYEELYLKNRNILELTEEYDSLEIPLFVMLLIEYFMKIDVFDNIDFDDMSKIVIDKEEIKDVFTNKDILYNAIKKYLQSPGNEVYNDLFDIGDEKWNREYKEFRKNIMNDPKTLEILSKQIINYIKLSDEVKDGLIKDISESGSIIQEQIDNDSDDEGITTNLVYLWLPIMYIFSLAYIFACVLNLSQYSLKANEELQQIFENLIGKDLENDYIEKKIYSIYEACYTNSFNRKFDIHEFNIIVYLNRYNSFYYNEINDNNKEFINELISKSNMKMNIEDDSNDIKNIAKKLYMALVEIDINKIFSAIGYTLEDVISSLDGDMEEQRYFYNEISKSILKVLIDSIPAKVFFYMYYNIENLSQIIKLKVETEIAKKERERYLSGDFGKEEKMIEEYYSFKNVKNGYEFEEYIGKLYKKLGYTIEEVTKKSGDQRSRCYCV